MNELGRIVIVLGILLVIVGGVLLLLGKSGVVLGRLPGDFTYRGNNTTVYIPIVSSVVVSVVLSLLVFLFTRLRR